MNFFFFHSASSVLELNHHGLYYFFVSNIFTPVSYIPFVVSHLQVQKLLVFPNQKQIGNIFHLVGNKFLSLSLKKKNKKIKVSPSFVNW